jgi:hypothetical protein
LIGFIKDFLESGVNSYDTEFLNPWWMVDFKGSYEISKIVVWNRADCCSTALSNATISLLNEDSDVVCELDSIGNTYNLEFVEYVISDFSCVTKSPTQAPSASPTQAPSASPSTAGQTNTPSSSPFIIDKSSQMWRVESVRLLPIIPGESQTWNQKWTVTIASDGSSYDPSRFSDIAPDGISTCYSATDDLTFNRAFETYAIGYVVQDASDEQMCGMTREKLGFSREYPFDTEVCDEFNSRMCDPLFTELEATSSDSPAFTEVDYTAPE